MEPDYRYQNRQQNFNQAPTPVQAEPQKQKKKGCPIAIVIICLILAFGGVGFGIYEMMTAGSTQEPIIEDCNCLESEDNNISTEEKEVQSLIEKIQTEIKYGSVKTYNEFTPVAQIEDTNNSTLLAKSYGLAIEQESQEQQLKNENAINKIKEILREEGFSNYGYSNTLDENNELINDKKTIICATDYSSSALSVISCSHTSWTKNENEIELAKSLSKAFEEKENRNLTFLNASIEDIKTNQTTGYQYIKATTTSAFVIFYRKDENSNWKFAYGGQAEPVCSDIDDEAKEALSGTAFGTCFDEQTQKSIEY